MLNSNDAALTSACDSVQELRLARAGEAKADGMRTGEDRRQVIKRKNAVDNSVKVVAEQSVPHFELPAYLGVGY